MGIEKVRENIKTNNPAQFYNIIFMDVNMPVMDGLEATKLIKEEI